MTNNERSLLRAVCDGNHKESRIYARFILTGIKSAKDQQFKENLLRKLDSSPNLIELPANLKELLIAEDMTSFPESRFILRPDEHEAVNKTIAIYKASQQLAELGIAYLPSLMLYGASGTGKTMLARYIAYKAELPFIYVRFSSLVGSHLGDTQKAIGRVFEYARTAPCVLCFDEIDAIGMARGQKNDVGEMNRIVISLMQELDRLPNNVIIVGTTNRYDRLDDALTRRFYIKHEVKPLTRADIQTLAYKFLTYAGQATHGWLTNWCKANFSESAPASEVITKCTERIVQNLISKDGKLCND